METPKKNFQKSVSALSKSPEEDEKDRLVFLGGLPLTVGRRDIFEYLSKFGIIDRLILPINTDSGLLKGHGKVIFIDKEGRDAALAAKQHTIKGVKFGITPWIEPTQYFKQRVEDSKRKLFVKHKTRHTEEELTHYFRQFGEVTRIDMRKNPTTNKSRNFCYVYFADERAVARALEVAGHTVRDMPLVCLPCIPSAKEMEQERTALEHLKRKQSPRDYHFDLEETSPQVSYHQNMHRSKEIAETRLGSIAEDFAPFALEGQLPGFGNTFPSLPEDFPHEGGHRVRNPKSSNRKKVMCMSREVRRNVPKDDYIKPTSSKYPRQKVMLIHSSHLSDFHVQFRICLPRLA